MEIMQRKDKKKKKKEKKTAVIHSRFVKQTLHLEQWKWAERRIVGELYFTFFSF